MKIAPCDLWNPRSLVPGQLRATARHSHVRLYDRRLDADAAVSQTAYLVSQTIIYKTGKDLGASR